MLVIDYLEQKEKELCQHYQNHVNRLEKIVLGSAQILLQVIHELHGSTHESFFYFFLGWQVSQPQNLLGSEL